MFGAIMLGAAGAIIGSLFLTAAVLIFLDVRENARREKAVRKWLVEHEDSLRK
jgi:hypothetical protein